MSVEIERTLLIIFQQLSNSNRYTSRGNATLVTAAHAIFIEHKGHKAPAAVVGLQFQHDSLARHFINITSAVSEFNIVTCGQYILIPNIILHIPPSQCTGSNGMCRKTCASDELDCYMLDNNGFVIISEDTTHTGRFVILYLNNNN